ncbi:hypothetical protein [Amycolatopsis sp.]|jgi:hypothetical protein|uniref:hypothetical protein n=1 Tax=Amycolatopsis sp. TaxID=37632 RepID=UPI002DF9F2A8|nr:hypothetical protein [Amycolatopsis sp.]
MPDFLDRLLARSVPGFPAPQGETVVTPRLPQLFEHGGAALDVEEFVAAASAPAVTTAAQPPIPVAPGRNPQRETRRPDPPSAVPAALTPRIPATAAIPVVAPPLRTASERITTIEAHSEHVREEHFTTVDHTVYQGEPTATLLPSTTVVVPAAAGGTPDVRRPGVAAARRGEQPQPLVRVSIGRVEVTGATKPDKPPARPKPARADPAMSLERYLSREEGRR